MNTHKYVYTIIDLITPVSVLLIFLSFMSCSNDPISTNNSNQSVVSSLDGYINGTVPDSIIVKAVMAKEFVFFTAGEDTISENHIMNMTLSEPPQNVLWNLSSIFPGVGFILSDNDVKGNYAFLDTYSIQTGFNNGLIFKADTNEISFLQEGNFYMRYIYADKGVSVSGSSFNINLTDTLKYNYNLNIGKGFNKFHVKAKTIRKNFKEYDFISGEPSNSMWFFILFF